MARETVTFDEFFEKTFTVEKASELVASQAGKPAPARLCGDLWREGELAVLFGESGTGKSILAVQMAESIARGEGFGPFEVEGGPRKVLYIDLKLTREQWAARYRDEWEDEAAGSTT